MKKIITILACVLSLSLFAQDVHFSQFHEQPLLRNPALSGIFNGNAQFNTIYRNQWQAVTVPYKTVGLSAQMKLPKKNGDMHSFGVQLLNDIAGDSRLSRTNIGLNYAFHKQIIPDNYLTLGVLAGPVSSGFNASALKWDDQFVGGLYNPANPTRQLIKNTRVNYIDAGVGLMFTRPVGELAQAYIGGSLFHFNRPRINFDDANRDTLKMKWGLNGGITFPSGTNSFTVFADHFWQGGNVNTMIGAHLGISLSSTYYDDESRDMLYLGAVYRWNDALIPVVKIDYKNLGIGISYDINTSKLTSASHGRGGFEFSISYRNFSFLKDRNEGLACPQFKN
jgi:type IX secretion system PorP/SprF family membrane protein